MEYSTKYHTKKELIKVLEERGIVVDNASILDKVNYSHLMYVFGKYFIIEEKENGTKYINRTTLSEVYNLFKLNLEASAILYPFFHEVEHKLKAAAAHWIASLNPLWYKDKNNYWEYTSTKEIKKEIDIFHDNINKLSEKVKIKYDKKYYIDGNLPIWILIDEMAFGQIIMLIKFCPEEIKKRIYIDFGIAPNDYKLLLTLKTYRNQLFHGNPLTSEINGFKLYKMIKYIKLDMNETFVKLQTLINKYSGKNIKSIDILNILKISSLFK